MAREDNREMKGENEERRDRVKQVRSCRLEVGSNKMVENVYFLFTGHRQPFMTVLATDFYTT
jgi:hypothetical protein